MSFRFSCTVEREKCIGYYFLEMQGNGGCGKERKLGHKIRLKNSGSIF